MSLRNPDPASTPSAAELLRYRDVIQSMEAGLHLYHLEDPTDDRTLRFVGGNAAAERITGAPLSAYIGRLIDECFPYIRESGVPEAYAEVARSGLPWQQDYVYYGDDRVLHAAYAVRAFPMPGNCVGVTFENATARVRAQEDLKRSEERQRALIAAVPDTLYEVRAGGVLTSARDGSPGPAALAEAIVRTVMLPLAPGEIRVFEYRLDGVDLEVRVLRSGEEEHLAIVRDISERKRAERRKDEFISIVSHELRTPLTSIHGALGLIGGGVLGELPPPVADLVQIARTNSDRLIRLINDLLDLDKIEAGPLDLELVPLDAAALAEAAVEAMRGAATSTGVRLRLVVERNGTVLGDADRLLQVLTNLLSNAVRFSPPQGSVDLRVQGGSECVRFIVEDAGPGVPPDRVQNLFQKFSQLGSGPDRRKGGTGLGLAISKAIVDQHDGKIGHNPRPRGAAFFVEIPAIGAEEPPEALIADLRTAYAAALPPEIERLRGLLTTAEGRAEAAGLAHRLSGTAGTYGLTQVSEAAARLEAALAGESPDAGRADALDALETAARAVSIGSSRPS